MKKSFPTLFLLLLFFSVKAQYTGLVTFLDKMPDRPHTHIIDLKEAKDHSIYLLGECKDDKFQQTSSWLTKIDANGKTLMANNGEKKLDVKDLKRVILTEKEDVLFLGNKDSDGGKPQSFAQLYDKDLKINTVVVMAMSYPIILGDAINYDPNTVLIAQSNRKQNNNKFNITLLKGPINKYFPVEFASIPSEFNELTSNIVLNSKKDAILSCIRFDGKTMSNIIYAVNQKGEKIWEYVPDVANDFINSNLTIDKNDNPIFTCSFRNATTYMSSTVVVKLDNKGKLVKQKTIENIKANGIMVLKNNKYLVYGANFQPYDNRIIISRAGYNILDADLNEILHEELIQTDIPTTMASIDFKSNPISTEFNRAIQVYDGRIAFGGRINYPKDYGSKTTEASSARNNQGCVLFTTQDGKFRKK